MTRSSRDASHRSIRGPVRCTTKLRAGAVIVVRTAGRASWRRRQRKATHPDLARFITGAGLDLLDIPRGLAPRALRDIKLGQAAGRFTVPHADIALSTVAGGLLGLLRVHQHHPEQIDETAVDQLAEAILRMLGVPAREAKRIAARKLPDIADW